MKAQLDEMHRRAFASYVSAVARFATAHNPRPPKVSAAWREVRWINELLGSGRLGDPVV
jgi:hypothetical protein